jgi:hypothetical protein
MWGPCQNLSNAARDDLWAPPHKLPVALAPWNEAQRMTLTL